MNIEDEIRRSKEAQEMMERERAAKELAERTIQSTPQAIRARLQEIIDKDPGSAPAVRLLIDSQVPELVRDVFNYLEGRGTKTVDTQLLTRVPYPHYVRVTEVRSNKPEVSVFPLAEVSVFPLVESGAGVRVYQRNTPLSWDEPIQPWGLDAYRLLDRNYRVDAFMKDAVPIIRFKGTEIRTTDEAWEDTLRQRVITALAKDE